MPSPPAPSPEDIVVALGNELRSAREDRGLSRAEIVERLGFSIQTQTLATYEQGTRQCTVSRFVEICYAIGVSAPVVLTSALQKAKVDLRLLTLRVDIEAIVVDMRESLQPLRLWARNQIKVMDPAEAAEVWLEPVEVAQLAIFCDLSHEDMAHLLVEFTPQSLGYSAP